MFSQWLIFYGVLCCVQVYILIKSYLLVVRLWLVLFASCLINPAVLRVLWGHKEILPYFLLKFVLLLSMSLIHMEFICVCGMR